MFFSLTALPFLGWLGFLHRFTGHDSLLQGFRGCSYAKNVLKEKESVKHTTHESISVSILIFRRGYDALCGDSVVSMLHQMLTKNRSCCAIPLFTYSARRTQGSHIRYVQSRCKGNQNRVASRCQCAGFVPERGRYLTPGHSA
jgi:hypothetical protein